MPFTHWLAWTAGLMFVIGTLCAFAGAKLSIILCSKQSGCAMRVSAERKQTTQDLEKQVQAMHQKYPELLKIRAEAQRILKETDENPAIHETKGKP
jgi:hypothetical protein